MKDVTISEFKRNLSAVLQTAQRTGERVRILRRGVVIAEVIPVSLPKDRANWLGSMKGRMDIVGDIVSSVIKEG